MLDTLSNRSRYTIIVENIKKIDQDSPDAFRRIVVSRNTHSIRRALFYISGSDAMDRGSRRLQLCTSNLTQTGRREI